MNKEEMIEKLKNDLSAPSEIKGSEYDRGYDLATKEHLAMVEDLDYPEKPIVPQFVADFYESIKDDFEVEVYELCIKLYNCDLEGKIKYWFDCDDNKPIETLVKMKLYGYEVNKDKLYTVELPNPNAVGHVVLCKNSDGIVSITFASIARWRGCKNVHLTEAEIKKDFEWAWQFAKEVEK